MLLETLAKEYPTDELLNKRGAIKRGIVEFFGDTFQEVKVSIIEGAFRITKEFRYPKKGEAFDRLLHEVTLDLLALSDDAVSYRHADFLWIFPGDIRDALLGAFGNLPEEVARALLRDSIAMVFDLDEKDIVLFLRSRIYIRGYTPPKPIPQGVERRFAGEDPDELQSIFAHCFPEGILEEIEEFLPEVLDEQLNFSVIDNQTFNKSYISVFRSMIEIILVEGIADLPVEKLEGLTGYVLRLYFDDILVFAARELLYYVETRDRNAEAFIKYYKDEVVIDADGRKIQKYAIIDAKQQTWNYSAILSVLMQFSQAKKRVEQQEARIESVEQRLEDVKRELAYERQEKQQSEEQAREVNELFSLKKSDLERKVNDAILQAQLNKEHSDLLDRLKIAKDNALFAARRYRNKQTELENWKKQLATSQKQLHEIRQQNAKIVVMINLIVDAVALVFSKR